MSNIEKRICTVTAILVAVVSTLVFSSSFSTAHANSAPKRWYGSNGIGAVTDENCPLEVEHENLDFYVTEYPKKQYDDIDELMAYTGKVRAEYTFYNPNDEDVTATLMFPFGDKPTYAYFVTDPDTQDAIDKLAQKYEITTNGVPVEKTIRHTYSNYSFHDADDNVFDTQTELARISDELLTTDFYKPDTTVTLYRYRARNLQSGKRGMPCAEATITTDTSRTRIMLDSSDGYYADGVRQMTVKWYAESNDTNTVIAIGDPLGVLPQWEIYENGTRNKLQDGTIELESAETMTFYDFVMSFCDCTYEIYRNDFYNAAVTMFDNDTYDKGYGGNTFRLRSLGRNLMRWYEYEMTVPAGERIVNAVTAPIYPFIDGEYKPDVYGYTYLLSPAACWKKFGTLDVTIHTNDYIVKSDYEFERGDACYTKHFDSLPDEELKFFLCSDDIEYPDNTLNPAILIVIIIAIIILVGGAAALLGPIIVVCAYLVERKKAKTKK